MSLSDIDNVLDRLGELVEVTERDRSRAGYFASMYRKVTVAVRDAIVADRFTDGDRVAKLDRVFAERYLDAHSAWNSGGTASASWLAAFDASQRWRPIIVQHLMLGMSAHINLDLGIAAATVAPGADLNDLKPDFDMINAVLAELIDEFMTDVGEVSPWLGLLDRIGGRTDQTIVRFSIEVARRRAWALAVELAAIPSDAWPPIIERRDRAIAEFAETILRPGPFIPFGLFVIRLRESNNVPHVIEVLGGT